MGFVDENSWLFCMIFMGLNYVYMKFYNHEEWKIGEKNINIVSSNIKTTL